MSQSATTPIALTEATFDDEVLGSEQPVLVDFWAEWCQPCRVIGPVIDALADELAGRVKVGKVDVDAHGDLSIRYGVTAIPTLLLFKNGEVVQRFVGVVSREQLIEAVQVT